MLKERLELVDVDVGDEKRGYVASDHRVLFLPLVFLKGRFSALLISEYSAFRA